MNDWIPDQATLERLRAAAGSGPLLILTHDNPDPDALAAGKALATLFASAWGIESDLRYSGLVLRAENRALLKNLTPEWERRIAYIDTKPYSAVALVDTQPGAGNNCLPVDVVPDIVIDHHNPRREALDDVAFVDVRPEIGATVTILDTYLEAAGIVPDAELATAMFYGLKTDTRGLSRGTSEIDITVYLRLLSQIDHDHLIKIEQAGLPPEYFQAFAQGLQAAEMYGRAVVADMGEMHRPDLAAEMADLLIRLNRARAVLCLGVHEETLHLSIRTMPMGEDAGMLVQQVIVSPGRAGGHGTMAGGQVPLAGQDVEQIKQKIMQRFLKVMDEQGEGKSLA
jgi:nanoRNase/pAp phosphatase (c-di-AMP/oligoRNAs hydrolase)